MQRFSLPLIRQMSGMEVCHMRRTALRFECTYGPNFLNTKLCGIYFPDIADCYRWCVYLDWFLGKFYRYFFLLETWLPIVQFQIHYLMMCIFPLFLLGICFPFRLHQWRNLSC